MLCIVNRSVGIGIYRGILHICESYNFKPLLVPRARRIKLLTRTNDIEYYSTFVLKKGSYYLLDMSRMSRINRSINVNRLTKVLNQNADY